MARNDINRIKIVLVETNELLSGWQTNWVKILQQ